MSSQPVSNNDMQRQLSMTMSPGQTSGKANFLQRTGTQNSIQEAAAGQEIGNGITGGSVPVEGYMGPNEYFV